MYELGSMARALDMQKGLAEEAHFIHAEVTRRKEHDPEVKNNVFKLVFNNFFNKNVIFIYYFIIGCILFGE